MTIDDYIARAVSNYGSLSLLDSLRSTMPVYVFMAFFILYVGCMIALLSGVKGSKWLLLFFIIIFFVGGIWVKLYQRYELKAPVKWKTFEYRLAQAMGVINLQPDISVSRKGVVAGLLKTDRRDNEIALRYTQDLWRNVGGIMPGTPVQTLRKIHPRTWFLEIRGKTGIAGAKPVMYDFSARKDDDDREDGYGVSLYDPKTYAKLNPGTDDTGNAAQQIRKAIDGTILKGTLTLADGEFILRIFDNLETIRRWRRPAAAYKSFQNSSGLKSTGVPPEQAAFYGVENLIEILVK